MALDGLFLQQLKRQLEIELEGSRVDKIHQPSKEELVFLLRKKDGAKRLLISLRAASPRIHLTESVLENPLEPPMFCMLLRKHLLGARFVEIIDVGLERVVVFSFEATNEMGDRVNLRFAVELIGKQTNAMLIGSDNRIIDSVRRTDFENEGRIIQPGAVYELPERREKLDPRAATEGELCEAVCSVSDRLWKAVLDVADGVSPLVAREILCSENLDTDILTAELTDEQRQRVKSAFKKLKGYIDEPQFAAVVDESGMIFEFSYMPITQYGECAKTIHFDTASNLLEYCFLERDRKERIKSFSCDMSKILNNIHSRILKKISVRKRELEATRDGEKWRVYGELLKANLYKVEKGAPFVDVDNYYDPEFTPLRIPLNPALSPAKNAERYFKEYKRSCNAAAVLGELIADSEMELKYIESVIDELKRAQSVAELGEIRQELIQSGYVRATAVEKRRKPIASKPCEILSPDGFKVLIGRNNRQNDELTLKIADKDDMWFHTKNIPGSHVVVLCDGEELPESTVLFAAQKAAENSDAKDSSSVPVDYTRVRYVKKPAGAKPGLVIYKNNKTVYVTPER